MKIQNNSFVLPKPIAIPLVILGSFAILIIISFFICRSHQLIRVFLTDEWLKFCQDNYPLDENHAYVIYENMPDANLEAGSIYVFVPYNDSSQSASVNNTMCRQIGSETTMDLTPYLGKPVYITGEFYHGSVLQTSNISRVQQNLEMVLTEKDVLRIDDVEIADSPQTWNWNDNVLWSE